MRTAIVWFQRDLRLNDNPALYQASQRFEQVIPLYIDAPKEAGLWAPGAASRWWLHHSLAALSDSLSRIGSLLVIRSGDTEAVLRELIGEQGVAAVYWNRRYEPWAEARDQTVTESLSATGIDCRRFHTGLLHRPQDLLNRSGSPYRVFTPFWHRIEAQMFDQPVLPRVRQLNAPAKPVASLPLADVALKPAHAWADSIAAHWRPGQAAAEAVLQRLVDRAADGYADGRDYPALAVTSRLSPHLHFGEISPGQIVYRLQELAAGDASNRQSLIRQLAWRDFAYYLLHHFPKTPEQPMNPRFREFPWRSNTDRFLSRWQRGRTGIPLVDAGMTELWETGWMHNRVRMITASFLTKNLGIHWLHGARWFWDTLVDADLANNTLGWQWVAGCGADAAPYFRIFNPVTQARKFDAEGRYVRRWLPQLAGLPNRYLHSPWEAPSDVLEATGIELGSAYPMPLVDLGQSRKAALAAYDTIRTPA